MDKEREFITHAIITASMTGGGMDGAVKFTFITAPGQENLTTLVGPRLTAQISQTLVAAYRSIPRAEAFRATDVPGHSTPKANTVTYFDQEYDPLLLQAFGVLMIRANLMEKSLVRLLSKLTSCSEQQAKALFHSTTSMKARVDLVKSALVHSGVPQARGDKMVKVLERVNELAKRRNDLVHAQWSFNGKHMVAELYKPNTRSQKKVITVTPSHIELLAADYRAIGFHVDSWALDKINADHIASNTDTTPSEGSPSS